MSPRSALPEHLNDDSEIESAFPDDSQFDGWFGRLWRKFKKSTKTWFVFGPRCHEWWARWREWPVALIAIGSKKPWRFETDSDSWYGHRASIFAWVSDQCYLSRVQYEKGWHLQIQWPLFFLIQIATWEMYLGFKRDADKVYWLAAYVGRVWK